MAKLVSPTHLVFGPRHGDGEVQSLEIVNELNKEYRTMRCREFPVEFVGRVVSTAKSLLGPIPLSRLRSIYDGGLFATSNEHNYLYLIDTMCFITKGYRPMSHEARLLLMDSTLEGEFIRLEVADFQIAQRERSKQQDRFAGIDTSEPCSYTDWVKKPGGLIDLLCTLVVLFGDTTQLCCNK